MEGITVDTRMLIDKLNVAISAQATSEKLSKELTTPCKLYTVDQEIW